MRTRIKTILIVVSFLCVTLSAVATALLASVNSSTPTLFVNPASIEDPAILPHDSITVFVVVESINNLAQCEFNLTFSPELLAIERVAVLPLQGQYPIAITNFNGDNGYIWARLSYKNASTISETCALVEVEFYVKDYGSTDLHFKSSALTDSSEQPIPHDSIDGFVWIIRRNVSVQGISPIQYETYVGRLVSINVTILNDGDLLENFTVDLFYNNTLIASVNLTLPSKEEIILPFIWNTSQVSPRLEPYLLKAEASILAYEVDTSDNTLVEGAIKIKIIGDVNGDGTVDINDLIAWDNAYGTHFGDPQWNSQADINMDNVVDESDAMLILDNYKETL